MIPTFYILPTVAHCCGCKSGLSAPGTVFHNGSSTHGSGAEPVPRELQPIIWQGRSNWFGMFNKVWHNAELHGFLETYQLGLAGHVSIHHSSTWKISDIVAPEEW